MYHNYMMFSAKKIFKKQFYCCDIQNHNILRLFSVTSDYETNLGVVLMLTCIIDI